MSNYIYYVQEHKQGYQKSPTLLKCGAGKFMQWDSIRFFIEEELGLHRGGKQNSFIQGKIQNISENLTDDFMVRSGHLIYVKRVPWWRLWEDTNEIIKPKFGPIYYPPAVEAYLQASSSLPKV